MTTLPCWISRADTIFNRDSCSPMHDAYLCRINTYKHKKVYFWLTIVGQAWQSNMFSLYWDVFLLVLFFSWNFFSPQYKKDAILIGRYFLPLILFTFLQLVKWELKIPDERNGAQRHQQEIEAVQRNTAEGDERYFCCYSFLSVTVLRSNKKTILLIKAICM